MNALNKAMYTNDAVCDGMGIANSMNDAEGSGNDHLEHFCQFHL